MSSLSLLRRLSAAYQSQKLTISKKFAPFHGGSEHVVPGGPNPLHNSIGRNTSLNPA